MLDLVIISGASKGIGRNIVSKCSSITNKIIGIASSEAIYQELDAPFRNDGWKYKPLRLDFTNDPNTIQDEVGAEINKTNPKNIGIVLCGAMVGEYGGIFNNNLNTWKDLYTCNVLGNLAIVKACEQQLKSGAVCNIIFFAGGGAASSFEFGGYALSKVAVVRAVENLAIEFEKLSYNASIVALGPGAVDTDMLKKVIANGGTVKTHTHIEEPTNFVLKYLNNEFDTKALNGRFLHVRDDLNKIDFSNKDMCKLRRIECR